MNIMDLLQTYLWTSTFGKIILFGVPAVIFIAWFTRPKIGELWSRWFPKD